MIKTTVKISGMACGMCEAHVCDAIRRSFKVKKVAASHLKKEAVIITENALSEEEIKKALAPTGYRVLFVSSEEYVKKGLFSFLKK